MVFSSIIFVFFFLPIALGGYYLLSVPSLSDNNVLFWRRMSNLFLLFASLVFYFWGEGFLVWIIITSTSIDYICGLMISGGLFASSIKELQPDTPRSPQQKFWLFVSIGSNLAFLCVFKYFNFGVDSYNDLMHLVGLSGMQVENVIQITLPLGISFYTFQSMSYTIDVYRGRVSATRNFIDFACYVTMFPQLVAGPIIRYSSIAKQMVSRTLEMGRFVSGVRRFILGLGKKVLIANTVALPAEQIFALQPGDLTTELAWLGAIAYTLQIYFDFSGYSDMAIGLGRMLGFEFQENFNYPYISRSVREFWRRWHISLSTWFRDYLYIPMGGNRASSHRTYFNLLVVFLLCGLWHGASWTFVVWGLYHGLFLILERIGLTRIIPGKLAVFQHIYTLLVVIFGWVIFASDSFSQAMDMVSAMVGLAADSGSTQELKFYLTRDVRIALFLGVIFSLPIFPRLAQWRKRFMSSLANWRVALAQFSFSLFHMVYLPAVFFLCIMLLSAGTHNPFIYFRF